MAPRQRAGRPDTASHTSMRCASNRCASSGDGIATTPPTNGWPQHERPPALSRAQTSETVASISTASDTPGILVGVATTDRRRCAARGRTPGRRHRRPNTKPSRRARAHTADRRRATRSRCRSRRCRAAESACSSRDQPAESSPARDPAVAPYEAAREHAEANIDGTVERRLDGRRWTPGLPAGRYSLSPQHVHEPERSRAHAIGVFALTARAVASRIPGTRIGTAESGPAALPSSPYWPLPHARSEPSSSRTIVVRQLMPIAIGRGRAPALAVRAGAGRCGRGRRRFALIAAPANQRQSNDTGLHRAILARLTHRHRRHKVPA